MTDHRHMNSIDEILASIRDSIPRAYDALERAADAAWAIQGSFVSMQILLEAAGLPEALKAFQEVEASARDRWDATK
jgi:hypothetical protein